MPPNPRTVEERLRKLLGQLVLFADLFEAVAASSTLRGGEGLSAEASDALACLSREAALDLRLLMKRLPVETLNLTSDQ